MEVTIYVSRKGETPNAGDQIELNNNAGVADEREIVDPSFLELVRLGIKSPRDPLIERSVKVVDELLRVETPHGAGWFRYLRDGYGEMADGRPWNWDGKYTGKGHLWVLLTGERGQYELARGEFGKARDRLNTMLGFANEGMMLPEQVWDRPQGPRSDLRVWGRHRLGNAACLVHGPVHTSGGERTRGEKPGHA